MNISKSCNRHLLSTELIKGELLTPVCHSQNVVVLIPVKVDTHKHTSARTHTLSLYANILLACAYSQALSRTMSCFYFYSLTRPDPILSVP